jgi:predicted ArsR family transcriptional regulator
MPRSRWSLLSRHGVALVELARQPDMRLRELAVAMGLSERAVQTIVNELVDGGMVERIKQGRRNHYQIRGAGSFAANTGRDRVADLLHAINGGSVSPRPGPAAAGAGADHLPSEELP